MSKNYNLYSYENDPKQSVSNAFYYVVLHPVAPHTSVCLTAARADAVAKVRRKIN